MRIRRSAAILAVAGLLIMPMGGASVAAATDSDHDGLTDSFELTRSLTNPHRADTNRNGIPDGLEDPDHDGLTNRQEQTTGTNPRRADTNGNGIRDDREDPDHDGLWNRTEFAAGTSPRKADTNGNGISDAKEDPDHDGLSNLAEQRSGTNPRKADTNGNGISDAKEDPDHDGLWNITEIRARTSPLKADTNADGIRDGLEDADGDGLDNLVEQRLGTNPGIVDSDHDGIPDGREDPDADGLTNLQELVRGTDPLNPDTNGNGILDGNEPVTAAPPPTIAGAPACTVFPASNVWNQRVDALPTLAGGSRYISSIGATRSFHMDFGSYAGYGIPYQVVTNATPTVSVAFDYADESDQVRYPIPSAPLIEGGSDHHVLLVNADTCRLYELWDTRQTSGGAWAAGSGATWDLSSNALRPAGWTSADAAGLPILPGLVRYDEVAAGEIDHALRFTAPTTRKTYIYPARHWASSSTSAALPPMGLRLRLKATANLSGLSHDALVIAVALQRYGMILADNGSPWYVSGMSDPRFNDDVLHELDRFLGSDMQVVDTSGLVNGP